MTITNQKYTGRTLYLMVEVSAGTYAQVGGLRADSLSIGNEEIDITDKSDDTWKKLLAGGNRSLSVSGSGFITGSTAFETLQAACHNGTPLNAKLVYKAGKAYAAPMLVTSCELNGEYNGAQQFSASLSSMNTPYIGIAGAVPTLDLNFAETGSIQPNIGTATMTMTRASAALYRDVDGYLKSAGVNVARMEHDSAGNRMGYLPEPQSTNLILRAQEFDNASWAKTSCSVVANAAIAPDGTATADKFNESGGGAAAHYLSQAVAKSASAIQYTVSIWAKAAERTKFRLWMDDAIGPAVNVLFDLALGTVAAPSESGFTNSTATIEPYRGGWYRCTLTATSNTVATVRPLIEMADANGAGGYAGDPTFGIYIWGAQLEEQPQTTSYIATTSAQVTRSADVLSATSITGISTTEGALVAEFYEPATGSAGAVAAALNDNTNGEIVEIYRGTSNGSNTALAADGSVTQASLSATAPAPGTLARVAIGFKVNDFAASFNGGSAQTDASGTIPTVNQLQIGHSAGSEGLGRPIKRISYYATKPANADIVALAA